MRFIRIYNSFVIIEDEACDQVAVDKKDLPELIAELTKALELKVENTLPPIAPGGTGF